MLSDSHAYGASFDALVAVISQHHECLSQHFWANEDAPGFLALCVQRLLLHFNFLGCKHMERVANLYNLAWTREALLQSERKTREAQNHTIVLQTPDPSAAQQQYSAQLARCIDHGVLNCLL